MPRLRRHCLCYQPLIAPLYRTHSAREVLAAFGDKPEFRITMRCASG